MAPREQARARHLQFRHLGARRRARVGCLSRFVERFVCLSPGELVLRAKPKPRIGIRIGNLILVSERPSMAALKFRPADAPPVSEVGRKCLYGRQPALCTRSQVGRSRTSVRARDPFCWRVYRRTNKQLLTFDGRFGRSEARERLVSL